MDDQELIRHIGELADEEKRLEERHVGEGLDPAEREQLERLEVTLDQLWDLLRQRRALRDAGRNPDEAQERTPGVVEKYWQ